jgi:RNA polymerase sigma-70 factor (ECF subfamily)
MSMPFQRLLVTSGTVDQLAGVTQRYARGHVAKPARTLEWTDCALAHAAGHGVMPALGALYERHHRKVYSVCRQMTRDADEAEDLMQEVFIHLVCKLGSFRGESQFTTWLHRLTVNIVLMHFRKRKARREQISEDLERKIPVWPRQSAGAQFADRIALDTALAQLPSGCRRVFILFDVEGYKHDEIAHLLGCSAGTSKSQLHRARIKLRHLLQTETKISGPTRPRKIHKDLIHSSPPRGLAALNSIAR